MIPYKMLVTDRFTPGDCMRACIASLLDIEPGLVPHFAHDEPDGDTLWQRVREWLAPQGLAVWLMAYPGSATLGDVLTSVGHINPNTFYMIGGWGGYGDHIVIAINDHIVHDPARGGGGLIRAGSNGYWLIAALSTNRTVVPAE